MAFNKISDAEMEIMELFWQYRKPMNPKEIIELISNTKDWKYSTVKTFLLRLVEKGFLACQRGKINSYSPLISREEYKRRETMEFLDTVHGGSLRSMLVSLTSQDITDEKLKELIHKLE